MKCTIPEISWHNREPVLSVDLHPVTSDIYKLATGGGDNHVLIWQLEIIENGAVKQEVVSDLTRHQRAVNCVRWSPNGQYLASADDDGNILIWQPKTDTAPLLEGDTGDKEIWVVYKVLRGHKEDVYDLSWSPDCTKLFSGSVDNTAIIWDIAKGRMDNLLKDHKGFVQGVTWDPENQLLATISTDRICRVFDVTGKQVKARIFKGKLPVQSHHFLYDKDVRFFHDDTFRSFFRRLQFSPDGSLLVVPSGHAASEDCKKFLNATFIFSLDNLNEPVAVLPISKQCSTSVRFCPQLYQLHEDGPEPIFKLPYRMIFAVGLDHDIILYDTQQFVPFARFQDIHYTRLTDLAWSTDGRLLSASSTDGFCSLITFEPKELGEIYTEEECEADDSVLDVSIIEEAEVIDNENVDTNNKFEMEEMKSREETITKIEKEETKRKTSFLEKWALSAPPAKKAKVNSNCVNNSEINKIPESKITQTSLSSNESKVDTNSETNISENNVSDDDCIILESEKLQKTRKREPLQPGSTGKDKKQSGSVVDIQNNKESKKTARKRLSLIESFCKVKTKNDDSKSDDISEIEHDDCIIIEPDTPQVTKKDEATTQCDNKVTTKKKRVALITLSSPGKKKESQPNKNKQQQENICDKKDDNKKITSTDAIMTNNVQNKSTTVESQQRNDGNVVKKRATLITLSSPGKKKIIMDKSKK